MESISPRLPDEIWLMIFDRLDSLIELSRCRLVCSQWRSLIHSLRISSLCVGRKIVLFPNSNELGCDHSEKTFQFSTKNLDFIESSIMRQILSRLKSFFIDQIDWNDCWNKIQQFINLSGCEHLEIYSFYVEEPRIEFNIPEVRILSIKYFEAGYSPNISIIMNAPKLWGLKVPFVDGENEFRVVHPHTITHLFTSTDSYPQLLTQLINLLYVSLEDITDYCYYNEIVPLIAQLKEFHFTEISKTALTNLIETKSTKNPNLKLIWYGLSVGDVVSLDEIYDQNGEMVFSTQLIINHFNDISRIVWSLVNIDYGELIDHFGTIPANFFLKFHHFGTLLINRNVGLLDLLLFIRSSKPNRLVIDSVILHHRFYKYLARYWVGSYKMSVNAQIVIEEKERELLSDPTRNIRISRTEIENQPSI